MTAFVLAAAVAALAVPHAGSPLDRHGCALPHTSGAAFHAPVTARKLGDAPDANLVLAVLRQVDGCDYQQVTRFHVSNPAAPAADQGLEVPGLTGVLVPSGGAVEPARPTSERR